MTTVLLVVMVVMMVVDDHDWIGIGGGCKGHSQSERGESGKSKNELTHRILRMGVF